MAISLQITSVPGALMTFYLSGTSTMVDVYSNPAMTTTLSNPVVADANGSYPVIWIKPGVYKITETDAALVEITPARDPVYISPPVIIASALPGTYSPLMTVFNTTDGIIWRRRHDNSQWDNIGLINGAGNIATVSQVLTATDNVASVTPLALAGLWTKGADITLTNTTLSLPATGGGYFAVAGSFDIDAINSATNGRVVWLSHTVARTIVYSSNLTTLTGVNMKVRAGDLTAHIRDGTAWKMIAYVSPTDSSVGAKTSGYTVTLGENGKHFPFTISSGATLSLPAAADAGSGFRVSVSNRPASTANVTIDPASSETIDGLSTRVLVPGVAVVLVCDGTNWLTESGTPYQFVSANQTITSNTSAALAHGLARTPRHVSAELVCQTAEHTFSVNDVIDIPIGAFSTGTDNDYGITVKKDATNVTVFYANRTSVFQAFSGGAVVSLTNANWRLRLIAQE